MRICFDIDGVLCPLRNTGQTYSELPPLPGAVEKIKSLKEAGHHIILQTARHMKTCNGNVALVIARQGKTLLDWLAKHEIPFDELLFGKPYADIYVDDNAYRFTDWEQIANDGSNFPKNKEKELVANH
jgi:capsule biosynthesis phosphatase